MKDPFPASVYDARVHWAPWAEEWLANAKRRRELTKKHEERAIKKALCSAEYKARKAAK